MFSLTFKDPDFWDLAKTRGRNSVEHLGSIASAPGTNAIFSVIDVKKNALKSASDGHSGPHWPSRPSQAANSDVILVGNVIAFSLFTRRHG